MLFYSFIQCSYKRFDNTEKIMQLIKKDKKSIVRPYKCEVCHWVHLN